MHGLPDLPLLSSSVTGLQAPQLACLALYNMSVVVHHSQGLPGVGSADEVLDSLRLHPSLTSLRLIVCTTHLLVVSGAIGSTRLQ